MYKLLIFLMVILAPLAFSPVIALAQHHGGHWGGYHGGGGRGLGHFYGHGPYWGWRGLGPVPWWWGAWWLPYAYPGYCFVPGYWEPNPYTDQPQWIPNHYQPCS